MSNNVSKIKYTDLESPYLQSNPTWHIEDSLWKATQIIKMLQKNKINPKTVVEIGCGAGEILKQLQTRLLDNAIQFFGYEISPDAFKLTKERQNERLTFYQEDLTQLEKNFDVLLMIDVFEHVDDYFGFIRKAKDKAIYKIYHIPLDMSVLSILTNYPIAARKKVGHLHYFMKDTALATLTDTNQQIIDWTYTHAAFEVNNKNLGIKGNIIQALRKLVYKVKPNLAVKLFGGFSLIVLTK